MQNNWKNTQKAWLYIKSLTATRILTSMLSIPVMKLVSFLVLREYTKKWKDYWEKGLQYRI